MHQWRKFLMLTKKVHRITCLFLAGQIWPWNAKFFDRELWTGQLLFWRKFENTQRWKHLTLFGRLIKKKEKALCSCQNPVVTANHEWYKSLRRLGSVRRTWEAVPWLIVSKTCADSNHSNVIFTHWLTQKKNSRIQPNLVQFSSQFSSMNLSGTTWAKGQLVSTPTLPFASIPTYS